ncbi:hypothetical protein GCM10023189_33470 [Nibrella saemangeumensis]|uniref:Disease resistance R13L4/SHOC-2-like LRR domain-containing protein n=1 Tax=Nibrella saemangeumensis TaxID=1084526 RepID=A0ABP8N4X8_9BACT
MKFLSFLVLLCSLVLNGYSQSRVVLLRDTASLQIYPSQLAGKYPSAFGNKQGEGIFSRGGKAEVVLDTMASYRRQFNQFIQVNQKRMPVKGVLLQTEEFIRSDGSYEWVICSFPQSKLTPDQEAGLLDLLRDWYEQHPFPLKTQTGFHRSGMQTMGMVFPPRTTRKGPGIITTLEAAKATNRPDTVKALLLNQLELTDIPEEVYRFPNLEELDLSRNRIKAIPERLTRNIPNLKRLSVMFNGLVADSLSFVKNRHLLALNIQGNSFTDIPRSIRQNRKLESLWLGNNKLKTLDIRRLRSLRRLNDLNLYNVGLTTLPRQIKKLRRLNVLDLYYNNLTELPRSVGRLRRLEQLAISHNQLRKLPESVAKMHQLQILYAHHNQLSALPARLDQLKYLRIVDIGYNWFNTVPATLLALPSLEELDLSSNNLQELPGSLANLRQLKKLYLRQNPVTRKTTGESPHTLLIDQLKTNQTEVYY